MTLSKSSPRARPRWLLLTGIVVALSVAAGSMVLAAPSLFMELDFNIVDSGNPDPPYDWANDGTLTAPTSGTPPLTWTRANDGGIFDGGVFNGLGAPPTAPTLTAQALAEPTIADAEFIVDPLASDTTADCGSGDPTVYTGQGGETNGELFSTMTFGTGSVPPKDEIANIYALAHRDDGALINELFFGAERIVNDGDSHLDFEFLQSEVTIPDACSGSFTGNRTQGDLLVAVDFTAGGTFGGKTLYEWHCLAETNKQGIPNVQPPIGTVCNPAAHGPTPEHYQTFSVGTNLVFGVNAGGPVDCGGWVCRDKGAGPTTSVDTNEFMEGGLDLNGIGFTGCISTFLPHTRSSASFTATLKDFGGPVRLETCRPSTILAKSASSNSISVGGSVTYTYTETNDGNVTLTSPSVTDDTCSPVAGTLQADLIHNIGDLNDNGNLDPQEAWIFICSKTYNTAGSYTNTATGHGTFGGADVTFCTDPTQPPAGVRCDQDERATQTVVVNPVQPAIVTNPNPDAAIVGATLHDSATLSLGFNPTGTITFKLYPPNNPTCDDTAGAPVFTATISVSGNATYSTTNATPSTGYDTTGQATGTYHWTASYGGDTNNGAVSSVCANEPVLIISPSTALNKTANATVSVTYTYNETNDGDVDLNNVDVKDSKCSPVTQVLVDGFNVGDIDPDGPDPLDPDGVMNPGETWEFECTTEVAYSVFAAGALVNSATAAGSVTGTGTPLDGTLVTDCVGYAALYLEEGEEAPEGTVCIAAETDSVSITVTISDPTD